MASLPALLYAVQDDCLVVNLYAGSTARLEVQGRTITIEQRTRYPWDGEVELRVEGDGQFALRLRIPGWCPGGVVLQVNGVPTAASAVPGTYAELRRTWKHGDRVSLRVPMPVRLLRSHPGVLENAGRVALTRGPLLYCLEAADHPGVRLEEVELDRGGRLEAKWTEELLGGLVVVLGRAKERTMAAAWQKHLYLPAEAVEAGADRPLAIRAVPYHAWGNRAPGAMQVWVREPATSAP